MKRLAKKKTKRATTTASRNIYTGHMTQMQLIFVSGARRQRILLRADLMVIDHGDGFPMTVVQVVESQAKHVAAMVQNVQCHHGVGEVSSAVRKGTR